MATRPMAKETIARQEEILNLDEIDKLEPEIRDQLDLTKIVELYRNAKSIGILVTGKTGTGKSTLVNGILGLNADGAREYEGHDLVPGTQHVTEYQVHKYGIHVRVWDSPGLQDGTANQDRYLEEMQLPYEARDLTLYCISAAETRFVHGFDNPDVMAMKKLTDKFGLHFWKNTVIVLTFANMLEFRLKSDYKFEACIQQWRQVIQEALVQYANVPTEDVKMIKIVPAGHYSKPHLSTCRYWLSALWFQCLETIPTSAAKSALIHLNVNRIRAEKDVNEANFKQELAHQPIVTEASPNPQGWFSYVWSKLVSFLRAPHQPVNNDRHPPDQVAQAQTLQPPTVELSEPQKSKTLMNIEDDSAKSFPLSKQPIKVEGVRRVWGTLNCVSNFSVKNAIVKLTNFEGDIRVRKKSKAMHDGRQKWWFILYATEEQMLTLDEAWPNVNVQTGWQLEHCTKPMGDSSP